MRSSDFSAALPHCFPRLTMVSRVSLALTKLILLLQSFNFLGIFCKTLLFPCISSTAELLFGGTL
jgi:hypothetical protein